MVLYGVFLVFILAERKELLQNFMDRLPKKMSVDIDGKIPKIQTTLLTWWKGQAILCIFIFFMTLAVLLLLGKVFGIHVENYLSLALIAGLCEFIPIIGPIIAMIPALLIGMQGGWLDVTVLVIAYISIQQIESLFLVPKVHGTSLQLSNLEVLVWMTLAGTLFGVLGILFTLPILAVTKILLEDKKLS
jgi:predicted PurR-regulated permease PerM